MVAAMARLKYGNVARGDGRAYAHWFCVTLFKNTKDEVLGEQAQLDAGTADLVVVRGRELMAAKMELTTSYLRKEGIKLQDTKRSTSVIGESQVAANLAGRRDAQGQSIQASRPKRLA